MRLFRTLILGVSLFLSGSLILQPTNSWSQVETGQIAGTVTDPSGALVTNANVTVKNLGTNAQHAVQTDKSGSYRFPGLEPAHYKVTIASGGFIPYEASIEVTVGGHTTVDAKLSVGGSNSAVEVVSEGAAQVNTQTQELSQVVDTLQLANLPSLTRNAYDFVALSGNVSNGDNTTPNSNSGQNLSTRGVGYAINGQRESGTEILIDGVENVGVFSADVGEQIPIDAVQEYSVVTNNFAAQYGRASGGVVNLTTKSGANQFHGSAWEFNRLSAYTANTYNNVVNDLPKGNYTRNQFGFAVGGPVIHDKLFFFESTEWTRVRSQAEETALIVTPQFLAYTPSDVQAYFSAFGSTPYTITNTLTAAQIGSSGVTLTGIPASTPIFGQVNFKANADAGGDFPQNTDRLVARVDYNLSQSTQMFFRYARERQDLFSGTGFYSAYSQYDVGSSVSNDAYLYSLSHTFTPTLFSNSKLSFTRLANPDTYDTTQQSVPMLMYGGSSLSTPINFPGLFNLNEPGAGGLPYGGPQNTVQLEEDLSWTKGKHSLQFGGQFNYIQLNFSYGAYAQAVEYLGTGDQTGLDALQSGTLQYYEAAVDPQGKLPCTQNPDGTLNQTAACSVTTPVGAPSYARSDRYKDWAVYGQDSFKITPRMTLNYGLRYEHYGVQHNNNQSLDSNFYEGAGSTLFQQIASGQVEIAPQSSIGQLWAPRWGTASPRLGFAYDVFGDGKTSLRGGFGISYERNFGNVTFNTIQNVPNYATLQIYNSANTPTPVTNSAVGPLGTAGVQPLPPTELRNVNPHINVAQTQFWSLALQRQIGHTSLVELSYSGAHGVHLYDITAGNPIGGAQAYLGAPLSGGAYSDCAYTGTNGACLTRPNDQYAAINVRGSGGSSAYDALNVKFQTQNFHNTGLSLIANYTWSHSLDDLSSTFSDSSQGGSGYIGNLGYLDPTHPMLDWGPSDYDVPNRITLAPIWETPWLKGRRSVLGEIVGGWTVSGIFTARSGTPFSVYDYSYNENGYSGVPRIVPSTPVTQHKASGGVNVGLNQFQIMTIPGANDLAPFSSTLGISDYGPFPSAMTGRNTFRGPGAWSADAALSKSFKLTQRVGLEFRAEGFDVFNHHNLYTEEYALDVSNPGTIGSPLAVIAQKGGLNSFALGGNHDERRFGQFAGKITF
ncbi:TonB-dependent receptor [Granulicella sp. S156]|uniref:TonB-dependent receptor n=1 Tax=Granulicella sp. S156 TaxID=1747224 RepID=UPI00131C0E41|nr:TonB-dependent receptor [Granulicella sp. S156]